MYVWYIASQRIQREIARSQKNQRMRVSALFSAAYYPEADENGVLVS